MNLNITIDKLVVDSSDNQESLLMQLQQFGNQVGQQLIQKNGLKSQRIQAIQVQSSSGISRTAYSKVCSEVVRSIRQGGRR